MAIVVGTWVTLYLIDAFGLPIATAGLIGSLTLATGIVGRTSGGVILEAGLRPTWAIRGGLALAGLGLTTLALAPMLAVAIVGLVVTGVGVGLPYAALFNGAAASVPTSPASAQAIVGWGGLLERDLWPAAHRHAARLDRKLCCRFLALAADGRRGAAPDGPIRPFDLATDAVASASRCEWHPVTSDWVTTRGARLDGWSALGADDAHDRVDQGQVGERLREIAEVPASSRRRSPRRTGRTGWHARGGSRTGVGPRVSPISTRAETSQNEQMTNAALVAVQPVVGLLDPVAPDEPVDREFIGDRVAPWRERVRRPGRKPTSGISRTEASSAVTP